MVMCSNTGMLQRDFINKKITFGYFLTGFIDYIVQPTLTVLGDTLDTMMAQLKGEERKPSSENGPGMAATKDSASSDASKGQSGSESAPITNTDPIHRPWTEILPINRSKWQESADKGESITVHTVHISRKTSLT